MTKKLFFGLAAAAMLSACTDDYKDWAAPVVNDAVPSVSAAASYATVRASVSQSAKEFNLATTSADSIQLFSVNLPANITCAAISAKFYNEGSNQTVTVASNGKASVADLNTAITALFGRAPKANDVMAEVIVDANLLGETGSVPLAVALDDAAFKAQPISPAVEESYSLVLDGEGFAMNHGPINVYDDPVFNYVFEAEEGAEWAIVSKSGKVYGFDIPGDTTPDGVLKADGENGGIEEDGKYKVTFNAETFAYTIEKLLFPEYIYIPGNAQGWSPATAPALKHQGDGLYTGFAYMDGGFKFTQERAWAAEYNNGSFSKASEGFDLGDMGGGNIECTIPGVYFFEVNVAIGELKATKINNMNLVGDFNGWNAGDDAQQMTWNAEELCYEISGAGVNANGWKFTANNNWDINLGGTVNDLTQGGDNLTVAGTTIKLYPCRTTSDAIYCVVK